MDRLYRIDHEGAPPYAVERQGALSHVAGDIFDGYMAGVVIPTGEPRRRRMRTFQISDFRFQIPNPNLQSAINLKSEL